MRTAGARGRGPTARLHQLSQPLALVRLVAGHVLEEVVAVGQALQHLVRLAAQVHASALAAGRRHQRRRPPQRLPPGRRGCWACQASCASDASCQHAERGRGQAERSKRVSELLVCVAEVPAVSLTRSGRQLSSASYGWDAMARDSASEGADLAAQGRLSSAMCSQPCSAITHWAMQLVTQCGSVRHSGGMDKI